MKLFYRLIHVQTALGGDIVLTHQSGVKSAHMFKVGFCDILIMPISVNEGDEGIFEIAATATGGEFT